jgi:hypothetical protein
MPRKRIIVGNVLVGLSSQTPRLLGMYETEPSSETRENKSRKSTQCRLKRPFLRFVCAQNSA